MDIIKIYILFLLLGLYISYTSPFLNYYKGILNETEVKKQFLQHIGINEESCLPSVKNTLNILAEKYDIHINEKDVTNNLRFIVGNCNPVILVPGIFSVKLITQIDCKGLYRNETDNYQKLKFFCLSHICKNADTEEDPEEWELFLKLAGPFGFLRSMGDKNLYNACFSYFMTIFNEDECSSKGKNICTKSDYIKVMFHGGTNKTIDNSKCGAEASRDVFLNEEWMSSLIGKAKVFGDIIDALKYSGYNFGFSLGGIPNDFRKFVATNSFATETFRFLVEYFYNNTGKQVIFVAHSFGNLVTLHNLVSEENKDLLPKIKKFVSIGPPFAGSTKLLDGYLHGLKDFNNLFNRAYFFPFGQSLLFKSVPTVTELRPLPIFSKLIKDPEYKEFIEAINERIFLEKKYVDGTINYDTIDKMSENFDNIFSSYFPSLRNNACKEKTYIDNRLQMKCLSNIFNIFDCPMIVALNDINQKENIEYYCNKTDDNLYYVNEMGEERKSIEELLTKGKFTYGLPEMNEFFEKYNDNIEDYKLNKTLSLSDFESEEDFRKENLLQIEYYKSISKIQDLPIPPVDTDIIYTSVIDTNTGEYVNKNDLLEEGENIIGGGDGTVSTWSSLLVGLKWIYDKKKNNLNQRIRLIEYCSRLHKDFPYNKDSNFISIGCQCLNEDNLYEKFGGCNHQMMLLDTNLISLLSKIIKEESNITEDRIMAAKSIFEKKDYEKICNKQLYTFAHSYKRPVIPDHTTRNFLLSIIFGLLGIILVILILCWFKCFACCKFCGCFKCCCCLCPCRSLQCCYCCKLCRCDNCDCCCTDLNTDYSGC